MTTQEKISKAKVQLIMKHPFFASIAMQLQFSEDSTVATTLTNGKYIRVNPRYFESFNLEEVQGVIAHDILHILMFHHTRRQDRNKELWNEATDYAINPMLIDNGFFLPDGYLMNKRFKNMSAEQIYALLAKPPAQRKGKPSPDNQPQPGNPSPADSPPSTNQPSDQHQQQGNQVGKDSKPKPGMGEVEDLPATEKTVQEERGIQMMMVRASYTAKKQGDLSPHIDRLIHQALQPKAPWEEALSRFISSTSKNDYTWTKPSARYLHIPLYLPLLEKPEVGRLIMLVDTSISVTQAILNRYGAEIEYITQTMGIPLTIVYVDVQVQAIQEIEQGEPLVLKPKGGGGTSFRPGFAYIAQQQIQPTAVIYLTDGECTRFPPTPDYPVLWTIVGYREFIPPFGEVISIH